ncbi:MAG: adenylate/guanylate cyclase domain-containing protein [Polyangiaceae bacterium]
MGDDEQRSTVLVVDDEPSMVRALSRTLGRQHPVVTASSGDEALTLLESRGDIGVVLSDYSMPGMSGVAMLRRALEIAPYASRILMSGLGELAAFREAIDECRLYTFIAKPFEIDALEVVVQRATEHHQLLSRNAALVDELGAQAAREKALRRAFQQYVPAEVVEEMVDSKRAGRTEGVEREVTVLLADLRGFTGFSERREPAEVVRVLNRFFEAMAGPVMLHRGIIDKYIGDSILAYFGGLEPDPSAADNAVRAALGMRDALRFLNQRHEAEGIPTLRFGVGINTGPCIVGNVGCAAKMDYTIIGDAVNVASRVQELTKERPDAIYITESTRSRLTVDLELPSLPPVSVRGRQRPVAVYRVDG